MTIDYAVEMAALPEAQIVVCNIINQRYLYAVEKRANEFPERKSTWIPLSTIREKNGMRY